MNPLVTGDLSEPEKRRYEWQMWVTGFGEEGQRKLKRATVLISRCGGVGGAAAYELAAAGIGKLILAHGGPLKPSDLNRQLLMSHAGLGTLRVTQAAERLRAFNPHLEIEAVPENINANNARALMAQADVALDCTPLFAERYLMNMAAIHERKPLIECAMYELEAQIMTVIPGETACLACVYPEPPPDWKREFPVFGAVSGMIGCLGAMEAIKVLAGIGEPLRNRLCVADLRYMTFRTLNLRRDPHCPICGG